MEPNLKSDTQKEKGLKISKLSSESECYLLFILQVQAV